MVQAFENFKQIQKLEKIDDKLRTWLKDYEGLHFSIAKDKKDLVLWKKDKDKYIYSDDLWNGWTCQDFKGNYLYANNINKIQRHKKRLVIEFDGDKTKEYLEQVYQKLKELGIGFIRSTHNGKSDYLWVEFINNLTSQEAKRFLVWICPEGAEIDLNFASDNKRFPILFAQHWKYPKERELPIEFFEGEQINYNALIFTSKSVENKTVGGYRTARVFSRIGQAETFIKDNPLFYDKNGL